METYQWILWVVLPFLAGAWTILCLQTGFRMGRQSIDKPLPSVIQKKATPVVDEDPWQEPMTGEKQKSYPTVEE